MLTIRIELENVNQWMRANRLTVNVSKTKYLVLGRKNKIKQINDLTLKLNDEVTEKVHEFKYLEMIIDECLTFEPHRPYSLHL